MKNIPVITKECEEAFKELSSLNIKNCQDFDALAKSIGYTDETFVNFLKDTEYSEKTLDNYQSYMKSASSTTSKFASTLKSIGANVAIMAGITVAIKLAQYAWDKANTTVEEVTEKITMGLGKYYEKKFYQEFSYYILFNINNLPPTIIRIIKQFQ